MLDLAWIKFHISGNSMGTDKFLQSMGEYLSIFKKNTHTHTGIDMFEILLYFK